MAIPENAQAGSRGPWVQLHLGHAVYLDSDDPVDPAILASLIYGIANTNRYSGALERQFNVASHSVLVGLVAGALCRNAGGTDLEVRCSRLLGFCHDLHEAITGDATSPVKQMVPAMKAFEQRVERRVLEGVLRLSEWGELAETAQHYVAMADSYVFAWETEVFMTRNESHEWNIDDLEQKFRVVDGLAHGVVTHPEGACSLLIGSVAGAMCDVFMMMEAAKVGADVLFECGLPTVRNGAGAVSVAVFGGAPVWSVWTGSRSSVQRNMSAVREFASFSEAYAAAGEMA